jgi:hypothetical protein
VEEAVLKLVYGIEELYPRKLEQLYPRVMEKIVTLWRTPMMDGFFQDLMVNGRGGDRQGFSPEVALEIYYLSKVFDGTYNLPRTRDDNLWAHLKCRPVGGVNTDSGMFMHSQADFINMRAPSDDSPWENVELEKRSAIEAKGYACTAQGYLKAIGARDIDAIRIFLTCRINIDTCDERQWTPLTIAAYTGSEGLTRLLIRSGANVHTKDSAGYSPIHWAAFNGHTHIIKLLIMKDADVNAASQRGWTPLMVAAMKGHLSSCATLIAGGANTNLSTNDGWTALQKASLYEHHEVVRLFLSLMKADLRSSKPKKTDRAELYVITNDAPIRSESRPSLTLCI